MSTNYTDALIEEYSSKPRRKKLNEWGYGRRNYYYPSSESEEEKQARLAREAEAKAKRQANIAKLNDYLNTQPVELINKIVEITNKAPEIDELLIKIARLNNLHRRMDELNNEPYSKDTPYELNEAVAGHKVVNCVLAGEDDYQLATLDIQAVCSSTSLKAPALNAFKIYLDNYNPLAFINDAPEYSNSYVENAIERGIASAVFAYNNTHSYKKDIEFLNSIVARRSAEKAEVDSGYQINDHILNAVANGQQPSGNAVRTIINLAHRIDADRAREYSRWASAGASDDGDSGASFAMNTASGVKKLDKYLHGTHWDSNVGSWHGGSDEDYEDAVAELISNKLSEITFVK